MLLCSIEKNRNNNLQNINYLNAQERETCKNYSYILTDEFTQWFSDLFNRNKHSYNIEETHQNAILLYNILYDYIVFKKQNIDLADANELVYSINNTVLHNNKLYYFHISNPVQYPPHKHLTGCIEIHELSDAKEYDFTLSDLQNFIMEQINKKQNSSLLLIREVVRKLEDAEISYEEILNALEVNYAEVANEQIKSQTGRVK